MAKIEFRCDGLEELQKHLKKCVTMDDVKRVVRQNGGELEQKIIDHAVFVKGYSKGDTAGSVRTEYKDDGLTAESGPTTDYSEYLERGTRKMDAQPFVGPAFDEQKPIFKNDLKKLVR